MLFSCDKDLRGQSPFLEAMDSRTGSGEETYRNHQKQAVIVRYGVICCQVMGTPPWSAAAWRRFTHARSAAELARLRAPHATKAASGRRTPRRRSSGICPPLGAVLGS